MSNVLTRWFAPLVVLVVVAPLVSCTEDQTSDTAATTMSIATTEPGSDEAAQPVGPMPRAIGSADSETASDAPGEGDETRSPETEPDEGAGTILLTELQVGHCVDLEGLDPSITELRTGTLVECDDPHDAEVFARVSLNDDPDAAYPGDDHVLAAADRVCLDHFAGYVGRRYVDARLEIVHLRPPEAAWARNDRTVVCAVVNAVPGPLVGSVAEAQ